jgi:metallo-beta-lactamase class B
VFGNVYDVGTCGIVVLLIVGDHGAVVVDGATAEAAPSIIANIERLGLRPSDVKLLLSTHEHLDHAGGLYELRRATGAKMLATAAERAALESGVSAPDDPQRAGPRPTYHGVRVDQVLRDGQVIALGSLRLTAHSTPGHAPGSTSWSSRSCEGAICHDVVFADSISAISSDAYRFTDHAGYVATFRGTLSKLSKLPCDLIVTPHPGASDLYERLAGRAPLSSATACSSYAATGLKKLDERMGAEAGSPDGARP